VAGNLKKDARRSEVEEGTGARECVSSVVASSLATMGLSQRVTTTRCKGRATRQATAKAWRQWAPFIHGGEQGKGITAGRGGIQLSGGEDLYWAMLIWWPRRTNHGEQQWTATGHRRRAGGGIFFSLCIVPWRWSFWWTDRASLGHIFSYFQMATHPVTYSKVVELYTIYNSTIGVELIWALDWGWIHTQIWLCYTENLNLRMEPDWQPNFRLNYLHYFLNNYAHTLKQSCSPMIGLQFWCGDLGQKPYGLKVTKLKSWAHNTVFQI
jgi:hypothetical protein